MEKIQVELNNRSYGKDIIYAALSLRGGYIIRNYIIGDSHFELNCAFYNVLCNYYRAMEDVTGIHFDVQRSVSTLSFYRKKADFMTTLESVLHILLNHEYDEEKFEDAKRITIEGFAMRYKEGAFRAYYKGHEFSDLNKCFNLKQLTTDIENITFEDFVKAAEQLLTPGNICIYITGETEELDFTKISFETEEREFLPVRIAGYGYDPYLRQDAHIVNKAREDHNLIIEAFDFLNEECTNFTKLFITELLAELIPVHEKEVWVDSLDASIMFSSEELRSYKDILEPENEKAYEAAHKSLLIRYISLLENKTEHFAIKASQMMSVGVYIDQYLEFLDQCSYELFTEIRDKADYKITEAQIVLRKELK